MALTVAGRLYPNQDPVKQLANFQVWIIQKGYPVKYPDQAFLGFCKTHDARNPPPEVLLNERRGEHGH